MEKIFLRGQFECYFCETLVSGSEIHYDTQKRICLCKECFEAIYKDREVVVVGGETHEKTK